MDKINRSPLSYAALERKHNKLVSHVLREKFDHIMQRLEQRLERNGIEQSKIKIISDLLRDLRIRFLTSQNQLRLLQKEAFWRLLLFIASGKTYGYFKLPTGIGKTRLFLEIIGALGRNKLVLVPKENLVENTYSQAVGNLQEGYERVKGFSKSNTHPIYAKTGTRVENTVENILVRMKDSETIIMTLATFVKIHNEAPRVFALLTSKIDIVISDEIHRLLGKKTQEALIGVMGEETPTDEEELEVNILESEKYTREMKKIHLGFTATPQLSMKGVDEYAECIYAITLETAIKYHQVVLPSAITTGDAVSYIDPLKDGDILQSLSKGKQLSQEQLARIGEKYQSDDGKPYSERAIEEYIQVKQKMHREQGLDKFPAVFFCASIAQAESVKQRLCSIGISAVRCTSGNERFAGGLSPGEAKIGIKQGSIEAVVTVSQVGEGWDVPELRCAIWLRPSISPSVILQGDGRIMRKMAGKNTSNTFIISPDKWILKIYQKENNGDALLREKKQDTKNSTNSYHVLKEIPNNMQLWFRSGEISWLFLKSLGNSESVIGKQIMDQAYFLGINNGEANLELDYNAFIKANNSRFSSGCTNSFICANGEEKSPAQWLIRVQRAFPEDINQDYASWSQAVLWVKRKLNINQYIPMDRDYFEKHLKDDYETFKGTGFDRYKTKFKCTNGKELTGQQWLIRVQRAFPEEIDQENSKWILAYSWVKRKLGIDPPVHIDRDYFSGNNFTNLRKDYLAFLSANNGRFSSVCKNPFECTNGQILKPQQWLIRVQRAFPEEIEQNKMNWAKAIIWVKGKLKPS